MIFGAYPAAYIRDSPGSTYLARACHAVAEQVCQRGWPTAELYIDTTGPPRPGGQALARLHTAITENRHASLLIAVPVLHLRPDEDLIALLTACTRHGVSTEIVLPPLTASVGVTHHAAQVPGITASNEASSSRLRHHR